MSSSEHKKVIWNLIKEIRVGMLVTKESDSEDSIRARPMNLVQDDYEGTLYFYTSKKAAKAFEVEQHRDVCITFSQPEKDVFVSLTGKAKITDDKNLIDKFWNPAVDAWFENGKDNPDLGMLAIKINKGEHWNAKESDFVQALELTKANVNESETPNIGVNEKFGVES